MEANPDASGSGKRPSSSPSSAAAAPSGSGVGGSSTSTDPPPPPPPTQQGGGPPSRYESQKRRDWNTFLQYLRSHKPPLSLSRCSGAHVIEFLKYLDQFGKTKVHVAGCAHFGHPNPPAPCACPLKQAWGSLDALIGRLRAAYEENGGRPESNPFGARAVRIYLREVRESQAKARGIPYEKKKRKRHQPPGDSGASASSSATAQAPGGGGASGGEPSSTSASASASGATGSASATTATTTTAATGTTSTVSTAAERSGATPAGGSASTS